MKILFVDDHSILREGIKLVLQNSNSEWQIFSVENGKNALSCFKENPDTSLIILDLNLNGESGLDLIKTFKEINPEVKILIYTSYVEPVYIHSALKNGIDGYITKGSSSDELIKAIKIVIAGGTYYNSETKQIVNSILSEGKNNSQMSDTSLLFQDYMTLTKKEKEVFLMIASGIEFSEIAEKQGIKEKTVGNIRSIIYQKLNIENRVDAVNAAKTLGLIL